MFIIYTIPDCQYCEKATKLLDELHFPYEEIIVEEHTKNALKKRHDMQTFPQIFYLTRRKQYIRIGGSDDLEDLLDIFRDMTRNVKRGTNNSSKSCNRKSHRGCD